MKKLKTRDVALVGLFAALTVICAWISIPLGPVPITLQTFAVFLGAALIEKYWKTGKPVLAICRGLQVLNVAFGGSLIQDIPAWCGANHSGAQHTVDVAEGSLLAGLTGERSLMVNSYHHQCVSGEGLAGVFVPTATWTGCGVTIVEAFEQPGRPLLAVQWHPERAYMDPAGLTNMDPLFSWLVDQARG